MHGEAHNIARSLRQLRVITCNSFPVCNSKQLHKWTDILTKFLARESP